MMSEDQTVSGPELSEWLGVSPTRIQQLAKNNHVAKEGRGRYLLRESVKLYTRFLRDSAQGRQKTEDKADYDEERAGLYRQKRIRAETENALLLGKTHDGDHVEKLWNDQISNAIAKLRTVKTKIAALVQTESELPVIEEIVGEEIDLALIELSEYDQSKFIEETIAALSNDGESLSTASEMDN